VEQIVFIKNSRLIAKIDRPTYCETYYLWHNGEVVRTGGLRKLMNAVADIMENNEWFIVPDKEFQSLPVFEVWE